MRERARLAQSNRSKKKEDFLEKYSYHLVFGVFGGLMVLFLVSTFWKTGPNVNTTLVNDPDFIQRAEIIREKGTDRSRFFRGEVDKYTWQEYTNFLLSTMPKITRDNYLKRFKKFIVGWKKRGYETIPDEAPHELEVKCWVPSWRRMCRAILRNDYYCKGLGQTQPKSEAYEKYKAIKEKRRLSSNLNNK